MANFVTHRAHADAKHLGGPRPIAAYQLERAFQVCAFDLIHRKRFLVMERNAWRLRDAKALHGTMLPVKAGSRNLRSRRKGKYALHEVCQLSHVARPVIRFESFQKGGVEMCERLAVAFGEDSSEVLGQKREILVPFP